MWSELEADHVGFLLLFGTSYNVMSLYFYVVWGNVMETREQEHAFLTIILDGDVLPVLWWVQRVEKDLISCDVTPLSQGFSFLS